MNLKSVLLIIGVFTLNVRDVNADYTSGEDALAGFNGPRAPLRFLGGEEKVKQKKERKEEVLGKSKEKERLQIKNPHHVVYQPLPAQETVQVQVQVPTEPPKRHPAPSPIIVIDEHKHHHTVPHFDIAAKGELEIGGLESPTGKKKKADLMEWRPARRVSDVQNEMSGMEYSHGAHLPPALKSLKLTGDLNDKSQLPEYVREALRNLNVQA